mgnify:CR=1 FL=1
MGREQWEEWGAAPGGSSAGMALPLVLQQGLPAGAHVLLAAPHAAAPPPHHAPSGAPSAAPPAGEWPLGPRPPAIRTRATLAAAAAAGAAGMAGAAGGSGGGTPASSSSARLMDLDLAGFLLSPVAKSLLSPGGAPGGEGEAAHTRMCVRRLPACLRGRMAGLSASAVLVRKGHRIPSRIPHVHTPPESLTNPSSNPRCTPADVPGWRDLPLSRLFGGEQGGWRGGWAACVRAAVPCLLASLARLLPLEAAGAATPFHAHFPPLILSRRHDLTLQAAPATWPAPLAASTGASTPAAAQAATALWAAPCPALAERAARRSTAWRRYRKLTPTWRRICRYEV